MMLFLLCFVAVIQYVSSDSCYQHLCLGCRPEEAFATGSRTTCSPENWVTAEWVHNLGHPPPGTGSIVPVEHRCLKMVASPDTKSHGHTVDVVRGCVPRAQVDSVCLALVAVERARGHSDARCFVCRGNDCNHAVVARAHLLTPVILVISHLILR